MTLIRRMLAALVAISVLALTGAALATAPTTPDDYDADRPEALEAGHLYAESALLIDMDNGEILLSKNSRVRMYPASTTKIMTMILGLESGIPLDQQVTIPKEADDIPEGSSVIGIKSKDVMSWEDLLYGLMLRSGNDGANAIAVLAAGSIDAFVSRMNQKAAELGCEGTHFVNVHGYHDEQHYTTAQDLARMAIYGMTNPDFRRIVATGKCEITVTRGKKPVTKEIENRNSLVVSGSNYYYNGANGIKTGHHKQSGRCVVASAERTGVKLLAVVMDCATEEKQFDDAKKLFNYGFSQYAQYSMAELLTQLQPEIATVNIENASDSDPGGGTMMMRLGDIAGGDVTRMIQRNSATAMGIAMNDIRSTLEVRWDRELKAPVTAGEVMGRVSFAAPDGTEVSADLIATRSIEARPEPTPSPTPTREPAALQTQTASDGRAPVPGGSTGGSGGGALWALAGIVIAGLAAIAGLLVYARVHAGRKRRSRRRSKRKKAAAARRKASGNRKVRADAGKKKA